MTQASTVPLLLERIESASPRGRPDDLLQAVARVIDDVRHLPRLRALRADPKRRGAVDDVIAALSRRCLVRVFEDGRVQDVKAPR